MSSFPAILNGQRARGWARSSLFWVLPAVVFALVVGWEIDWGRQIVHAPAATPAVNPPVLSTAVLPDYQIEGGLPAHGETVARTLFNATRRPAPVLAGDGGPHRLTPGQFQLVGTAVTGDHNVAFLKESAGGKSRVVKQGDEINGVRVAMVGPDRVKLALGDETEELFLKVAPGPKTTLAAAPPPPGAPAPAAAAAQPARAAQQPRVAANPGAPTQPQDSREARRAARQAAARGAQGADPNASTGSADSTMSTGGNAAQAGHRHR
jgi:hypothetical protein